MTKSKVDKINDILLGIEESDMANREHTGVFGVVMIHDPKKGTSFNLHIKGMATPFDTAMVCLKLRQLVGIMEGNVAKMEKDLAENIRNRTDYMDPSVS